MLKVVILLAATFVSGILGGRAIATFSPLEPSVSWMLAAAKWEAEPPQPNRTIMEYQLRMYTIRQGEMAHWITEWRRSVYPLRVKFGFKVIGPWVIEPTNQFVWILGYDGPEGFKARDAAYYASPERKAVAPDPARLIQKPEQYYMSAVEPST